MRRHQVDILALFDRALELNAHDVQVRHKRATLEKALGRAPEARYFYLRALVAASEDSLSRKQIAREYAELLESLGLSQLAQQVK